MSLSSKYSTRSRASALKVPQKVAPAAMMTPMKAKLLAMIDVNLGKDKGKMKLEVYDGDSPESVARKFAQENGLNENK